MWQNKKAGASKEVLEGKEVREKGKSHDRGVWLTATWAHTLLGRETRDPVTPGSVGVEEESTGDLVPDKSQL